jgi:hypothetical protein
MPKKVGGTYQRKNKPKGNQSIFTIVNINNASYKLLF